MPADPFEVLGIAPTCDVGEIRRAWRRSARSAHPDAGGSNEDMRRLNEALVSALRSASSRGSVERGGRPGGRFHRDVSSFTIDVLPVESYAALEIVAAEIGSLITDDPPYMIEFSLHQSPLDEGGQSWCRCDLVPEAGATTIHITVGSDGAAPVPSVESVRDLLVAALNSIDWPA